MQYLPSLLGLRHEFVACSHSFDLQGNQLTSDVPLSPLSHVLALYGLKVKRVKLENVYELEPVPVHAAMLIRYSAPWLLDSNLLSKLESIDVDLTAVHCFSLNVQSRYAKKWFDNIRVVIDWLLLKYPQKMVCIAYSWPQPSNMSHFQKNYKRLKAIINLYNGKVKLVGQLDDWLKLDDWIGRYNHAVDEELLFDASLNNHATAALKPYFSHTAYYPHRFDCRTPAFVQQDIWSVRRVAARYLCDASSILPGTFLDLIKRRLLGDQVFCLADILLSLHEEKQKRYQSNFNFNIECIGFWPNYYQFNWQSPVESLSFLLEVYIGELFDSNSSTYECLEKMDHMVLEPLDWLEKIDSNLKSHYPGDAEKCNVLESQIEGHAYLDGGRPDISNDSAQIINEMGDSLGHTLEVGVGYGVLYSHICKKATSYVGVDLSVQQAKYVQKLGVKGVVADIHSLPFANEMFDSIIADNVLEHAYDPLVALSSLYDLLVPGGKIYAVIPFDFLNNKYSLPMHLWKADRESIRVLFEKVGFEFVSIKEFTYNALEVQGAYPASNNRTATITAIKPKGAIRKSSGKKTTSKNFFRWKRFK